VYRDDLCAVCGESLPPDHFYCREHGATVDERLREIGELLPRVTADAARLSELLDGVAQETWDYIAEQQDDDPDWPPSPAIALRADAEDVDVEVDTEPGLVRLQLSAPAATILEAVAGGFDSPEWRRVAGVTVAAEGYDATH
jgi:hypothetical protein